MHLRYAQQVCVGIELDPGKRSELIVEEDLSKVAVDVPPACWNRRILFCNEHLFFEDRVIAIARHPQCTGLETAESATKVGRVRVEPVGIDRSPWSGTKLTGKHHARKWRVGKEASGQRQEHCDVWLRDGGVWLPHVRYICISVGIEEVVVRVRHAIGNKQYAVVVTDDCVIEGQCEVARLATRRRSWEIRKRHGCRCKHGCLQSLGRLDLCDGNVLTPR